MILPGNEENLMGVLFFFFLHTLLCDIQHPFSKKKNVFCCLPEDHTQHHEDSVTIIWGHPG